jgi:UDP-glucose 4-epimerase
MKVAITGASGTIGTCLTELLPGSWKIVALSRNPEFFPSVGQRSGAGTETRSTDYSLQSLISVLRDCNSVVHLAAARLGGGISDDELRKNIRTDYNVFKACEENGIRNVVFASTRGVYGTSPQVPWTEETKPEPQNLYALGKLQSEITAGYFNRRGLSIKSLRIAQVLSLHGGRGNAAGDFIARSIEKKPLRIFASESEMREFIYVKDVAGGIIAALGKPDVKGVFNLGSGEIISIPELGRLTGRQFHNPDNVMYMNPDQPQKTEYSLMDSSLFTRVFGFSAKWDISSALSDMHDSVFTKQTH